MQSNSHSRHAQNQQAIVAREVGGREGIRTPDPLLAKQVLSQLSYTPTAGTSIDFKAFAIVRKLRNTTFPPLGVNP